MPSLLYQHWTKTVERDGCRSAVSSEGLTLPLNFDQLQAEVAALEARIHDPDALRNRVVLFQLPNSAAWLAAFLLCQKLDAIALPVDADVPQLALEPLVAALRPALIITTGGQLEVRSTPQRYQAACLIKLTSGSTGLPKPLFFAAAELIADGNHVIAAMGIRPEDCNCAVIPFGHSYGLGNLVMPFILNGNSLVIANDPLPHAIANAVCHAKASILPAVPALINALVRSGIDTDSLATLRLVISAGSPLEPHDAQAFLQRFGIRVHNFYGSSETGAIAYDDDGESALSGNSVGRLIAGVQGRIMRGQRLLVSGPAVHRRNNRRQQDGHAACLLGDQVKLHADGQLELHGRQARLIKIGGKRLNPAEIERALKALGTVKDAYVCAYANASGRTRLGVAILPALAPAPTVSELRDALKERLASWKIPVRWLFLDRFPLTARGKTDSAKLCERIQK